MHGIADIWPMDSPQMPYQDRLDVRFQIVGPVTGSGQKLCGGPYLSCCPMWTPICTPYQQAHASLPEVEKAPA